MDIHSIIQSGQSMFISGAHSKIISGDTSIDKMDQFSRSGRISTGNSIVIYLTLDKDRLASNFSTVEILLMGGIFEAKIMQKCPMPPRVGLGRGTK